MKIIRFLVVILAIIIGLESNWIVSASEIEIKELEGTNVLDLSAEAVILMEASTGTVVYEVNSDEQLAPASVTKVMTLLLIFDALEEDKIQLDDEVITSSYAASMGGSQIYLEAGEIQTVETLIKSIVVASANDACVAMAEYISGSAEQFVIEMNDRADGLGMSNTNFVNCNGLDAEGHVTTARDIALMSQELINTYPQIMDYTMIWTEDIIHETSSGNTVFGLTNTNKLIQEYAYTTGLKTGSTDDALFCISATAQKDGIDMIAVVMAAPTSADRIEDAITLLNYGFSVTDKFVEETNWKFEDIPIEKGINDVIDGIMEYQFTYIDTQGNDLSDIRKEIVYIDGLEAPIYTGEIIGYVTYYLGEEMIGTIEILACETIDRMKFWDALKEILPHFLL